MTQVGIVGPVKELDTVSDCGPALLRESNSKLDHSRGLCIRQLGVITLIRIDGEDVHGEVDGLFADLLGHLDDR
jgi:hypothetical protein